MVSNIDVLLVSAPNTRFRDSLTGELDMPLSLAYIGGVIEREGYSVEIIDSPALDLSFDDLEKIFRKKNPRVVGFTSMTPDFPMVLRASQIAKEACDPIVIIGGIHPTVMPDEVMSFSSIDIAVRGEGELTIIELLKALEESSSLDGILGVSFKENSMIRHNEDRPLIQDLDVLPRPARHLLPMKKYNLPFIRGKNAGSIMGSRGCPYNCIYCSTRLMFGRKVRYRDPKNVISEIEDIIQTYGVETIRFFDDTFTVNKKWVNEICDMLKELGVEWNCITRVDQVNKELLKKMKESGCYLISYGVESGSQEILDFMRKSYTLNQVRDTFKTTHEIGIETSAFFMIGMPMETRKSVQETIKLAKELDPLYVNFSIVTPYPGSDVHKVALEKKLIRNVDWNNYSYQTKAVMDAEHLSAGELEKLQKKAMIAFYLRPKIIFRWIRRQKGWGNLLHFLQGAIKFSRRLY